MKRLKINDLLSYSAGIIFVTLFFQNCGRSFQALQTSDISSLNTPLSEVEIPNNPDAPLSAYILDSSGLEGSVIQMKIKLNKSAQSKVTLKLKALSGTALLDTNFEMPVSEVQFLPGETVKEFQISTRSDELGVTSKDFSIEMDGSASAEKVVLAKPSAKVSIIASQTLFGDFIQISGAQTFCGVTRTGKVRCWGPYSRKEAGQSQRSHSSIPQEIEGVKTAVHVETTDSHTCVLLENKTVSCWGLNQYGQLGDGSTQASQDPVAVVGITDAKAIVVGTAQSCALLTNESVKCWGGNFDVYDYGSPISNNLAPVEINGLRGSTHLSLSNNRLCAVLADKTVKCLGRGNPSPTVPTQVPELNDVVQVTLGYSWACAMTTVGNVKCWGDLSDLLFDGVTYVPLPSQIVPKTIGTLLGTYSISSNYLHLCRLTSARTVQCLGNNFGGQTGARTRYHPTFFEVPGVQDVKMVVAGGISTCALKMDGRVQCWGMNLSGALGNNTFANSVIPIESKEFSQVLQYESNIYFSCGLAIDRKIKCFGNNMVSQLGIGTSELPIQAQEVMNAFDIKQFALGNLYGCAVNANGLVFCWGEVSTQGSFFDNLAQGPSSNRAIQIPNLRDVKKISIPINDRGYACVLFQNGDVNCVGSAGSRPIVSNKIFGVAEAVDVVTGFAHGCALSSQGTVVCWGSNASGQLGNNSTNDSISAVPVQGISGVVALSSGADYTCALTNQSRVKCWGANQNGQLGTGNRSASLTPTEVMGVEGAINVTAGLNHACALLVGKRVKCWGANTFGQLGNGTTNSTTLPVDAVNLIGAEKVVAGYETTSIEMSGRILRVGRIQPQVVTPLYVTGPVTSN